MNGVYIWGEKMTTNDSLGEGFSVYSIDAEINPEEGAN